MAKKTGKLDVLPDVGGEKAAHKRRGMNLCVVKALEGEESNAFVVVADETANLRTDNDVTKWMTDNDIVGEVFVLAFRRGEGVRSGKNSRLRRRRYKPDTYVID